jgi:hypothetical protein
MEYGSTGWAIWPCVFYVFYVFFVAPLPFSEIAALEGDAGDPRESRAR